MSTTNDKAKIDFMGACGKDFSADLCERMWNEAKAKIPADSVPVYNGKVTHDASYTEIAKELETTKTDRDRTKEHLKKALDMLQHATDEKQAVKEAARKAKIDSIYFEGKGMWTKEQLTAKSDDALQGILEGLTANKKDDPYASVGSVDSSSRSKKPKLTVGEWDADKKQWVGGQ